MWLAARLIPAAHSSLSHRHPILTLWRPHFRYTLAVNQASRYSVFGPGGKMDVLHAPTFEAQLLVNRRGLEALEWDDLHPERDFARRRVADPTALPVYPVRDD